MGRIKLKDSIENCWSLTDAVDIESCLSTEAICEEDYLSARLNEVGHFCCRFSADVSPRSMWEHERF